MDFLNSYLLHCDLRYGYNVKHIKKITNYNVSKK